MFLAKRSSASAVIIMLVKSLLANDQMTEYFPRVDLLQNLPEVPSQPSRPLSLISRDFGVGGWCRTEAAINAFSRGRIQGI